MDDGPSLKPKGPSQPSFASLLAVWLSGFTIQDVRLGIVQVDALDSTDTILRLLSTRRTDVVFLSGASFAGFNVVDCRWLHAILRVPLVVISRDKPNNASVKSALKKHFPDWKIRWRLVQNLGRIHTFAPKASEQPLYFEAVGVSPSTAKMLIRAYCVTSRVPEPVRVAGIMAKGLSLTSDELRGYSHEIDDV